MSLYYSCILSWLTRLTFQAILVLLTEQNPARDCVMTESLDLRFLFPKDISSCHVRADLALDD